MLLLPAIDIKDGKCVRLNQGKFHEVTIYNDNPVEVAKLWESLGAKGLHVVDLDGARSGKNINRELVERIVKGVNIPVQVGGGIRDFETIQEYLELGVDKIILGTSVVENKGILESALYLDKLIVSIDSRNGYVATRGWEGETQIEGIVLAKEMEQMGIKTIVYTDILRDGTLKGPNFDIYKKLKDETTLNIIASGGIADTYDLDKLRLINVYGAIVGKALYEDYGKFIGYFG